MKDRIKFILAVLLGKRFYLAENKEAITEGFSSFGHLYVISTIKPEAFTDEKKKA